MSKSGVPFYNPYTSTGLNAVEMELFDDCEGHPDGQSRYHYHQLPSCLYQGGNNELMGVALDGYPIFGPKDENGVRLTTADLDFCHGRWYNGRYQYHITRDFPYIMSCYRGDATSPNTVPSQRPRGGGRGRGFSCYAYCENPGTDTTCVEPEYTASDDSSPQSASTGDPLAATTDAPASSMP